MASATFTDTERRPESQLQALSNANIYAYIIIICTTTSYYVWSYFIQGAKTYTNIYYLWLIHVRQMPAYVLTDTTLHHSDRTNARTCRN
jgi:hypothetical protein